MQGLRVRGALGAVIAGAVLAVPAQAAAVQVPDQVIVQFEPGSSAAERAEARASAETRNLDGLGSPGARLLGIDDDASVARTIRELEAGPAVVRAEPNGIEQPLAVPNDPRFSDLWGMHNVAQPVNSIVGIADADIDAPEAWDIETGSTDTVVAIMDSGADLTHPDLAPMLWQNPGEVPANGADDDANGFVDDVNGYDFVGSEDPNPLDATGHGTHVAGTTAAAGNDGFGVTGVSQRASIMVLRVCNVFDCEQADQIQAINYAAANGASVLNGSLGGFSSTENTTRRAAIFSHPSVLHVFAAGNDGANADNTPTECDPVASPCKVYPCAHAPAAGEADNTLCVAATGHNDLVPGFSNTGATSVDLGAPGTNILSTSATRTYFTDTFEVNDFAARWDPNPGDDFDWSRTNEAPLNPSFGITDTPGANYAANTEYGTRTVPIPVGAVSERGCELRLRRSIDLALGDSFRVALLHNGVVVNEAVFTEASDSGLLTQTLGFSPPPTAGNLQIRLRLVSVGATVANGVHVDNINLECGETPGQHNHEFLQGTSMSSPHVAGAAALVFSRNPELQPTDVRSLLLGSVDPNAELNGVSTSGGRLNVGTAIARTPPTTAIASGPEEGEEVGASTPRRGGGSVSRPGARVTFSFSSSDPLATFECALDGEPFLLCENPARTRPLGPGPHSLSVRAVDPRGNADATPATRSFTVESVPPNTKITKAPKKRTDAERATFKFKSSEARSTFQCRIDRNKFRRCRSPKRYKRLDPQKHKFLVRAIDPVGNIDASPAKKRWQVRR